MKRFRKQLIASLIAVAGACVVSGNVLAEKPPHAGKDRGSEKGTNHSHKTDHDDGGHRDRHEGRNESDRRDRDGDRRDDDRHGERRFDDRQRVIVHDYYRKEFERGRCPPGLRRKHNGCVPPGHAHRWEIGRPLARDVVFYDLPRAVIVDLGPPPRGTRYVRVANNILLIAIGTGMVLDALADLSAQ